ncbi:hypothetical protein RM780_04135 [Streptomyces sp. DSM 44917]|uniref:Uncharacterized protein n=1 Tax=Streptomyces boetiae TaxID=3075541 RepID=A0ABU2L3K9_9ACTN|nr:hypothetical protein [Streptomyces sp. DSM 44917]MDT0306151.1 hypothetical protein [Streptomyces sp. DSM 44917]
MTDNDSTQQPEPADPPRRLASDIRLAVAFNALGAAVRASGDWLRLSTRDSAARAVLAALDQAEQQAAAGGPITLELAAHTEPARLADQLDEFIADAAAFGADPAWLRGARCITGRLRLAQPGALVVDGEEDAAEAPPTDIGTAIAASLSASSSGPLPWPPPPDRRGAALRADLVRVLATLPACADCGQRHPGTCDEWERSAVYRWAFGPAAAAATTPPSPEPIAAPGGLREEIAAAIVAGGGCVDLAAATDAALAVVEAHLAAHAREAERKAGSLRARADELAHAQTQLESDLARYEEVVGEMNAQAIRLTRRAEEAARRCDYLQGSVVPDLRRDLGESEQTVARWRDRAETAEAALAVNPPGGTGEVLPPEILARITTRQYLSTACDTAQALAAEGLDEHAERLHARCRRNHKFTGALCVCECHNETQEA